MTNENIIEIKKQNNNWFIKGLLYLALMLASLYLALTPLVSDFAAKNSGIFYVTGFSLFAIFTFTYVFNIYKVCNPENAIILSAHGFIDKLNVGEDIEIQWTNVSAVKMLGKSNTPYLGVTLENADIVLSKMKKKNAAEMRENIDQNLPTLLIPQSTVKTPIKELKDTFAKLAREARILDNDSKQKSKNNPFSTDDVLRAFGKLPQNDEKVQEESEVIEEDIQIYNGNTTSNTMIFDSKEIIDTPDVITSESDDDDVTVLDAPNDSNDINITLVEGNSKINDEDDEDVQDNEDVVIYPQNDKDDEGLQKTLIFKKETTVNTISPFEVPEEITPSQNTSGEQKTVASDSFYEALRSKAISKKTNNIKSNPNSINVPIMDSDNSPEEELPDEIKEILNRAKSSKISQIEEILNSPDIPYSLSREKDVVQEGAYNDNDSYTFEEAALADENADSSNEPMIDLDSIFNESDNDFQGDMSQSLSLGHLFSEDDVKNSENNVIDIKLSVPFDEDTDDSDAFSNNPNDLSDTKEFF